MKVRLTVTVDINPEAWTSNYGVEGAAEIREDVKSYVHHLVTEHLNEMGVSTCPW